MYDIDPQNIPTVLAALREGNLATLVNSLDADEREEYVIAVPPGSGMVPTVHTLIRYGNSQAVLTVGGDSDDGSGPVNLMIHAHDNEQDAIECHRWKAEAMAETAAAAYAAAHGPAGRAYMALKRSGALDEILRQINGDR